MRFSLYKNDRHIQSGNSLDVTEVFTMLNVLHGTNTGLIAHSQATPSIQEYWKVPIKHDIFTIINLDS